MVEEFKRTQKQLAKHFEFIVSHPSIFAEVDEVKFLQIVQNLISNAIKFTYDNGIIRISIEDKGELILLTVADDGIGIPEYVQPFLFDKFTRARRPGLRGEETTGLGMSIIKMMVELHQGKIWFESQENKGTTFFVQIPKFNK